MKKVLFCIFIINCFFALAQKPNVTDDFSLSVGPKYKRLSTSNEYHFVFGKQMLSLKKINKAFAVQRHNIRDLTKLPATTTVSDKGNFVGTLQLKDTVLLYYQQKNKLITQKLLISSKIPSQTKTVITSKNPIANDVGFTSRFGYDAGNRINAFAIKKSFDKSKFVIVYTDSKKSKKSESLLKNAVGNNTKNSITDGTKRNLNISVYNSDMSLDWQRNIKMPYGLKKMNAEDFMVDPKGDFYMSAAIFEKNQLILGKPNKTTMDFHIEIFKINKDLQDWEIKKIDTDKTIDDAVLYLNTSKKPIMIGFYTEKEVKGNISGVFNATINTSTSSINPILHPIPLDTLKAYNNRKISQIKKGIRNKKDIEDLEKIRINEVFSNSDGTYCIFAEQRFAERNSYYANGATTVSYDFYYKNAYACKINGTGDLLWFNQLPKNQYGRKGKQSMSFKTLTFGNFYYVILWEKFANLYKNTGDYAELFNTGKREYSFMATYKIDNYTGVVKKLPVINSLEVDRYRLSNFKMDKSVLLNSNEIIFEGNSGNSNYLFKLQLSKN